MQLFITNFDIENNLVYIREERVFNQIRKILRWKPWYIFEVQNNIWKTTIRIKVKINEFQKNTIVCDVLSKTEKKNNHNNNGIIISLLNKYDKMNLLVQKLSEIWISNIYFWKSDRSIISNINENKYERFLKISLEAVEQSKWWYLPNIKFISKLEEILTEEELIILDMNWISFNRVDKSEIYNKKLLIWPEWWFSEKDFEYFDRFLFKKVNIWDNVYRAETAWIIWWWMMKNIVE